MHAATMTGGLDVVSPIRRSAPSRAVVGVAGKAVGHRAAAVVAQEVAARLVAREAGAAMPVLREVLVRRLCDAAMSPESGAFDALKSEMRRARISAPTLAEGYIPEAARRFGLDWDSDRTSFAGVTMAMTRLQSLLRHIEAGWTAEDGRTGVGAGALTGRAGGRRSILVILPDGEQHSLGALVVAGQLRRMGVSVCLRVAPTEADLKGLLVARAFDGAMLSLAASARIAAAARIVRQLGDLTDGRLFVAVGGSLATERDDLAAQTGARIASNDLTDALQALGLDLAQSPMSERV